MTPPSAAPAGAPPWRPDVLPGYAQATHVLGADPDGEGEIVATLVRRGEAARTGHAVLAVHGYTDYFFHTEVADFLTARGFAFYALDLRKCGRSWRNGQTPHFTTDLARYDAELEWAMDVIADETGGARTLVYGHSAGGLVVLLWLDRRMRDGRPSAGGLVLNSPWFDLQGRPILRSPGTAAALLALARLRSKQVIPVRTSGAYGSTLHRDFGGEFDYNLEWKPVGGFPVTYGWLHAVRRGHARLHRGLDVGVPNLVLRSDRSVLGADDPAQAQCGDAVLDVAQIARWAGCLGNRTLVVPIPDARHDVFLSQRAPRTRAFAELGAWLDWYATVYGAPDPQAGAAT
ncbi:alpha/beta hydrolase [Mycobacterium sp. MYCO198283]|uniref:alpha/beta hydrolase n=1 Tax=Mycobacterium sp. MYCO198283 TaxID=2883505 RepID=UPI001E42A66D|nr:alpha/beta hydrolase [Mycobacterium sp. MYCO198283]MCG5433786.1 alpha/beta hydrolase [Mycobacterium sp. MYCO198283]